MTCSACPSQWDAETTNGDYVYIRLRHGCFSLEVNNSNVINETTSDYDGVMNTEDMIRFVNNNSSVKIV